jgi:hypothetical protein
MPKKKIDGLVRIIGSIRFMKSLLHGGRWVSAHRCQELVIKSGEAWWNALKIVATRHETIQSF